MYVHNSLRHELPVLIEQSVCTHNSGMRKYPAKSECPVLYLVCNTCQANSLKVALDDQSPNPV